LQIIDCMFLELNESEIDDRIDYDDYVKLRSDWIFLSSETTVEKTTGTHSNPCKLAKSIIKNRRYNKEYKKKMQRYKREAS
jgi:hypothetical protein